MSDAHVPFRILLVDPIHPAAAGSGPCASGFGSPAALGCEVVQCSSVPAAVQHLSGTGVHALALSLELEPDAAATIVAEVERRHPGMSVIGFADRLDDARIALACHLGAVGVMLRPLRWQAMVQLLCAPAPDAGFSGTCSGLPTAQLLSILCFSGADGVLHLHCDATTTRDERRGSIYLEAGQPVHASWGHMQGADAVHEMLAWRGAETTWLPGRVPGIRTIVGRWQGILARAVQTPPRSENGGFEQAVAMVYPDVIGKLSRLAQTADVLGAFLLRNAEVVAGRCSGDLDERVIGRALCRLAKVALDVEAQQPGDAGTEIQANMATMRLVVDRIGPRGRGFQVGVVVRQAAPVCKSLRRVLRQIDGAFERALQRRTNDPAPQGWEQRVA